MRPDQRVVVSIPLVELWDERGPVAATRGRRLGRVEIAEMLRSVKIQFVVATGAEPLRWISIDDRFTFWTDEVKPRVVPADAEAFYLGDYPGEYCYLATEWTRSAAGPTVILLECHH
jgi:hypothetical protein